MSVGRQGALAAAVAAVIAAGAPAAWGDVVEESSASDSVRSGATLTLFLTVPRSAGALLVAAVDVAGADTPVASVTWNGVALGRISAITAGAGAAGCRVELWSLLAPAAGSFPLRVDLTASAAFGMGAVSFGGVSQLVQPAPLEGTGESTAVSLAAAAGEARPIFGSACAGGATTPRATADPGQDLLWDFTEPSVVGLGGQRLAPPPPSALGWGLTSAGAFSWAAAGVLLTPLTLDPPPDAAADSAPSPDAIGGADAGARDGAVTPDAGARDVGPEDAAGAAGDSGAREDVPGEGGSGSVDLPSASVRDVLLQVGCACQAGAPAARVPGAPAAALAGLAVWLGRRRVRRRLRP